MGSYVPLSPPSPHGQLVGGPTGIVNVRAYDQERENRLIRIRAHQRGAGRKQEFGTGDEAPPMVNPIPDAGPRLADSWGRGHFRAKRERPDKSTYEHEGIDILASPGTRVLAPVDGVVGEPYDPYHSDSKKSGIFTAIPIQTEDGTIVNVMYVERSKMMVKGQKVVAGGTVIGTVQDQRTLYPGIKNHVHVEVKRGNRAIDPTWAIYGRR